MVEHAPILTGNGAFRLVNFAGLLPRAPAAGAHAVDIAADVGEPSLMTQVNSPHAAQDWARPVVHFEIEALDPERQKAFYRALFNWEISAGPIMSINPGIGGPEPGPGGHLRPSHRSGVVLYVQVRDLRESLDRAAELGGKVTAEPFQLPNTPTLAGIEDPEGNSLILVQQ
jgi:hypothetical protein